MQGPCSYIAAAPYPLPHHLSTFLLPETTPANVMLAEVLEISRFTEKLLDLLLNR
jgi:hypothetical protein